MNLNAYLKQQTIEGRREFAKAVDTSLAYLNQLSRGFRRASGEMAARIEHASHSAVTARELRPDIPWPNPAPSTADRANDGSTELAEVPPLTPDQNRESHHARRPQNSTQI